MRCRVNVAKVERVAMFDISNGDANVVVSRQPPAEGEQTMSAINGTTNEHQQEQKHLPAITYLMNEEVEQTHVHKLKAEIMLEQAGFSPATDYRLIREKPRHEYALGDEVDIHEGDRFEILHRGPTPTS